MADLKKASTWSVGSRQRGQARRLRRDSTAAEKALWSQLRAHRFLGISFRRQTPIGPYIADFVCHAAGLVIEIDGGSHFETKGLRHDARRTAYLAGKGYRVIRFDNAYVVTNRQGVLDTIYEALAPYLASDDGSPSPRLNPGRAPSLTLPRKRERE